MACEPSRARRLVQIRERLRRELHAASDAAFDRSRDFHAAFSLGRPRAELKFAGSRRWPGKANPDKSGLRTELQALRRRRCSVPRQKVVRRRRILRRQSDDHPVGGRIPKGAQVRAGIERSRFKSLLEQFVPLRTEIGFLARALFLASRLFSGYHADPWK